MAYINEVTTQSEKAKLVLSEVSRLQIAQILKNENVSLNPAMLARRLLQINGKDNLQCSNYSSVLRHLKIMEQAGVVERYTIDDISRKVFYKLTMTGRMGLERMGYR